jgi:hypothetical protein
MSAAQQYAGLSTLAAIAPPDVRARILREYLPEEPAEAPPQREPRQRRDLWRAWWLPVILLAQALLTLRLIWTNTAFQDEALYLWAGHRM